MSGVRAKSWSPYAVGFGIGVVSWFAFATAAVYVIALAAVGAATYLASKTWRARAAH